MFENAKAAIRERDFLKARELLAQLIKEDKKNADYWLWMSAAVDSTKERIYCLKEALQLDPENRGARFGLQLAGEREFDPRLAIPLQDQSKVWEKRFIRTLEPKPKSIKLVGQIALFVVVVAALAGAGWFLLANTIGKKSTNISYQSIVGATATPSLTPSPGLGTPRATSEPAKPLWMRLINTYTPTPLYVVTPQPLLEAYSAGLRAYLRNDWQSVINYFQQVLAANPNALDAYYLIGEAYRFMGEEAKALQVYNQCLTKNDAFAPAYFGRARTELVISPKNWQDARDDLLTAILRDPNMGEAYLELTTLEIEHGTTKQAQEYLNVASSLLPGSPLVTYYQAKLDFMEGYTSKAFTEAAFANAADITYLPTYRLLGEILQSQGKIAESLPPLQTYLLYVDQDMAAWVMIGKAYAASGDLDNALQSYNLAIQGGLRSYDLWIARAELYIAKGDGDAAYNDFTRALSADYTSFEATLGIGKAYVVNEAFGTAYNQISRAEGMVQTMEQKAAVYYWRAQALHGLLLRNEVKPYVVIKEWQSLLALPETAMPSSWRTTAQQQIDLLRTPTPGKSPTRTTTPPTPTKSSLYAP